MLYNRVSIYMSIYEIIYIYIISIHISDHIPYIPLSTSRFLHAAPERTQCNPTANRTFLEIDPWNPWPPLREAMMSGVFFAPQIILNTTFMIVH